MKYTHPSTAAVARVTVATDSYESEIPEGFSQEGRLPKLPPHIRGFSSSIEYAGDGSPRRSSLRTSPLSSPDEGSWPRSSSGTPRVTFENDVPITVSDSRGSSFGDRGSVVPDNDEARMSMASSAVDSRPSVADSKVADVGLSDRRASSTAPGNVDEAQRLSKTSSADQPAVKKSVSIQEPNADAAGPRPSTESRPSTRESTSDTGKASRPSTRESTSDTGRASQVAEAGADAAGPRASTESGLSSRKSTSDTARASQAAEAGADAAGARSSTAAAEPANTSANNPQSNVNTNATGSTNTGNVLVRLYRKLFRKSRDSRDAGVDVATPTPTSDNTNANNLVDDSRPTNARIPPSTSSVDVSGNPTSTHCTQSSAARATVPSAGQDKEQFIDDEDDDDDDDDFDETETTMTESDGDSGNEYTQLLRQRRQPLPELAQLCRTSFKTRTVGGDTWSRRPFHDHRKSTTRRRYDAVGETSSD